MDSADKVGVGVVEFLTKTTATARPFAKDGGVKPMIVEGAVQALENSVE